MDSTGHVKLTDFGLATGALSPKRIESLKIKVARYSSWLHNAELCFQLDQVKDNQVVHRSTIERRSIYRSTRNEDPRYANSIVGSPDYMVIISFFININTYLLSFRHQRFWEQSSIPIQSTTGHLVVSFLSFWQAFLLLVVAHRRRHGLTSKTGQRFSVDLNTINPRISFSTSLT